eukprot:6268315-Pyramimonas_sp.AAC.1
MQYGVGVHGAPPPLVEKMRSTMRNAWTPDSALDTACIPMGPTMQRRSHVAWNPSASMASA